MRLNTMNKIYVKARYISDYDTYIPNIKDEPIKWKFITLNDLKHVFSSIIQAS